MAETKRNRAHVSVSLPHLIMAIIGYIFIFSSFRDVEDNYNEIWWYVLIWASASFLPLIYELFLTPFFSHQFVYNLISLTHTACWIWGWVIISRGSELWSPFRSQYRSLSDLIWSYQIISIFVVGVTFRVANNGKESST